MKNLEPIRNLHKPGSAQVGARLRLKKKSFDYAQGQLWRIPHQDHSAEASFRNSKNAFL